ncbi:MAG: molybdopterin-dependent oxidoreductase [Proteobacteria bacterium]|nr:molybdopterin-dependent oxidoreductase [Pseudomonadota bacterium]
MVSRRNFLKLGAATAAASAALAGAGALTRAKDLPIKGGKDFSPKTGKERAGIPTACWQCVTRCAAIGYVEDGRLVKMGGQPDSIRTEGKMCAKGQAGVNQVYDPDRILYPLRRVGKRGEGKWKRITWDEALTEVAGRLKKLRDEGQPEKFMFHYGRMKASSSKLIKSVFLATYGTNTIGNHTSICEGGKWTAQELTWGSHFDNWDFDNTRFVLNFGSNCLEAHTNHVPVAHRLVRALVDRSVRMVTFDVKMSNTAAKSSEWVPIKPGTDGAVALAMCHVIMSEDLYRGEGEAFMKFCKFTNDPNATPADKVAALKAHLASYTPAWAENISGVGADKIRALAREFATTKPACVISYRGAVAHYNGNDTERAIQMLAAITGNVDNPGGRCKAVGAKWKYPKGPKNKPKGKKLEILDGFKGDAALPTHHVSHRVLKMIKDGKAGRPEVYMWYCYTPVYANGEVQENIDILKDESLIPFTVCVNPFYDESAALADLILPDATYLERWDWEDMVSPRQIPEFYIRQPVVKPLGEARDFGDVCCDLAERMGFPLGFKSKEEFVRLSCEMTPGVKEAGGFEYMKEHGVWHDPKAKPKFYSYSKRVNAKKLDADGVILDEATDVYWNWKKTKAKSEEEAREKGYAHTKNAYKGYVAQKIGGEVFIGFKPDKLNKSGYMEFYSTIMEDKGFAPLPTYMPIPEHEAMKPGELILTTYKVAVQIHSRSQNCKWLTEIYYENPGWINPVTAAARGISDGDAIKVKSPIGEIETRARVTPAVVPGVIAISHHCGHWEYGRYASGKKAPLGTDDDPELKRKWWKDNGVHPNWIIANAPDPINGQLRFMDTVVSVSKVAIA